MAKDQGAHGGKPTTVQRVEQLAGKLAQDMGLELVEVTLQKESRGKCLCVYVDKDGGLTLDDCERYHKVLQPLLEDVDYDIMEVSSPGVDRPIKTQRDFEKHCGDEVEVKMFAPVNGAKLYQGTLKEMDDKTVAIVNAQGETLSFERKAIALIKPILTLNEADFAELGSDDER